MTTAPLRYGLFAVFLLGLAAGPAAAAPASAETGRGGGAAPARTGGGEASLVLPDLNGAKFFGDSVGGKDLLYSGLIVSALGLGFGLLVYSQLKNMPVHSSMRAVSELIYETCKTYLVTQGKFLAVLWLFIGAIIAVYFGALAEFPDPATGQPTTGFPPDRIAVILAFSVVGILGSYGVAWFGIRVNTFANSR
ncbi:MAG: sodium/proton-translocating pyrophosphatase, partial [Gemmataceae bacterium]|nr:sodium/proton-translocating pyrophosphatase [Gemmataceae bacterium]